MSFIHLEVDKMVHVILFDCAVCKNLKNKDGKLFCAAYPDGIPSDYKKGKVFPHHFSECRNGTKFEDTRPQNLRRYMDEPAQK